MRAHLLSLPLLTLFLLTLAGCASWMPEPDPNKAWIDLQPRGETELQALAVDRRPLDDNRYFQVEPGAHELGVQYRFGVEATNVGGDALERACRLTLAYDGFKAGQRYRLEAGGIGFRPWARLYDDKHFLLARGVERGCGDLAER